MKQQVAVIEKDSWAEEEWEITTYSTYGEDNEINGSGWVALKGLDYGAALAVGNSLKAVGFTVLHSREEFDTLSEQRKQAAHDRMEAMFEAHRQTPEYALAQRRILGEFYVRNEAQRIMFTDELSGQISDGMWENLGVRDHYIPWTRAKVIVNPDNVGHTFYAPYDAYDFVNKDLLEIVGDRMLAKVQETIPDYTRERMLTDLRDLKKIKKLVVNLP